MTSFEHQNNALGMPSFYDKLTKVQLASGIGMSHFSSLSRYNKIANKGKVRKEGFLWAQGLTVQSTVATARKAGWGGRLWLWPRGLEVAV